MKKAILFLLLPFIGLSQTIEVDEDKYTPEELIENILINSNCISNVKVTEAAGGNFSDGSKSFGYFNSAGTNFPLDEGLVLSTGKLKSITKPSSVLSDDDAPGWDGDDDLDDEFNVETHNATILEFDFVPEVSGISFRYLFASEEYQARNDNTCRYSDVFGFFIRPISGEAYENIALVPNTQTPVSVTTVHPYISDNCRAINEPYFDRFNYNAETVFDGQTVVLTASTQVIKGETYHVKLVIADDFNYRFDSAVFIEAGSFKPSVDIGPDRLIRTNDALCENETLQIVSGSGTDSSYKWFKDGNLLISEVSHDIIVDSAGNYMVEVTTADGCISKGDVQIEFYPEILVNDAELSSCAQDDTDTGIFDLYKSDSQILFDNQNTSIEGYFLNKEDAINSTNPILTPNNYSSSSKTIYAGVHNDVGCVKVASIQLNVRSQINFNPNESSIANACTNQGEITIRSGVLLDDIENVSYQWYLNGNPINHNSETIIVSDPGIYRVEVTNGAGCTGSREIELRLGEAGIIEDIKVENINNSNQITVLISGNGTYQFALDSENNYQNTNIFSEVSPGVHSVFVKETNGCGIVSEQVAVFGYENFFTPNNDGYQDTWKIEGIIGEYEVYIYDRYGKLYKRLSSDKSAWDGSFRNLDAPAGEYWFKLFINSGIDMTGHFSLVR